MKTLKRRYTLIRGLALVMILLMVFGVLPAGVFAAEETQAPEQPVQTIELTIETVAPAQEEAVEAAVAEAPAEIPAEPAEPAAAGDEAIVPETPTAGLEETPALTAQTAETPAADNAGTQDVQVSLKAAASESEPTMAAASVGEVTMLKIGNTDVLKNPTGPNYTFDQDTNTLTLNGITETTEGIASINAVMANTAVTPFNLVINGTNVMRCVYVDGKLVISGTGSLEINNTRTTTLPYALQATKDLTINSGTIKVTQTLDDQMHDADNIAIISGGSATINGGTVIGEAITKNPGGIGSGTAGMFTETGIVINGGVVTMKGTAESYGEGIGSYGDIIINGGKVTAYGKGSDTQPRNGNGIYGTGAVLINGGEVTLIGEGLDARAVYAAKGITLGKPLYVNGVLSSSIEQEMIDEIWYSKAASLHITEGKAAITTETAAADSAATVVTVTSNPSTGLYEASDLMMEMAALGLVLLAGIVIALSRKSSKKD